MKIALAIGPFLIALVLTGNSLESATSRLSPSAEDKPAVLVGAGDIADCLDLAGAEATAKLIEQISGTVMAVGDLAYPTERKRISLAMTERGGVSRNGLGLR